MMLQRAKESWWGGRTTTTGSEENAERGNNRKRKHPSPTDSGLAVERCSDRGQAGDWLIRLHLQCPTSLQAGERLEGMLVCRAGPGCNNASSAVSRCRQSDLPGTPRRIRATSAGTGRGATWGDASHTALTSLCSTALENHGKKCCWSLRWAQQQCPDGGSQGLFELYLSGNLSFIFHMSPHRYFLIYIYDFFEIISFKIQKFQFPH